MTAYDHDCLCQDCRGRRTFANRDALTALKRLDAEEEIIMQDYIEAHGWFYDGANRWRKDFPVYQTLRAAYEQELQEEKERL